MNIGFYAPLKSPDSAIPSGDREMAKLLFSSLQNQGHEVKLVSRFKSREPKGLEERQKQLKLQGEQVSRELIQKFSATGNWRPDLWFTYHMFYKAPDLIGPKISAALKIPYVVAEASHSPKRARGRWSLFHREVEKTIAHADLIIGMNTNDHAGIKQILNDNTRYEELRPFLKIKKNRNRNKIIDRRYLEKKHKLPMDSIWLLAVGMMREGDKFASYKILSEALTKINTKKNWNLIIIGDGPLRTEVEQLFSKKIIFTGQLTSNQLQKYYSSADIFLWPAINEAYGMALLEAQSSGMPAVAGDSGGVGDILRDNETGLLSKQGDATDFADKTSNLIDNSELRRNMSLHALMITNRDHSFDLNSSKLGTWVSEIFSKFGGL
jgi:glycosyltransferase involved in cell wall biosynthesis